MAHSKPFFDIRQRAVWDHWFLLSLLLSALSAATKHCRRTDTKAESQWWLGTAQLSDLEELWPGQSILTSLTKSGSVCSEEVKARVWAAVTSPSLENIVVSLDLVSRKQPSTLPQPTKRLLGSHLWNMSIMNVCKMVIYAHLGVHQTFSSSDLFTYNSGRCVHKLHHSLFMFIKSGSAVCMQAWIIEMFIVSLAEDAIWHSFFFLSWKKKTVLLLNLNWLRQITREEWLFHWLLGHAKPNHALLNCVSITTFNVPIYVRLEIDRLWRCGHVSKASSLFIRLIVASSISSRSILNSKWTLPSVIVTA